MSRTPGPSAGRSSRFSYVASCVWSPLSFWCVFPFEGEYVLLGRIHVIGCDGAGFFCAAGKVYVSCLFSQYMYP